MFPNTFLKDVEIVVRYCYIEEPYWLAFINHYYSLGVRKFHIIVRFKSDQKSVEAFTYKKDLNIETYNVGDKYLPNQSLKEFNLNKIKRNSKYLLLLDCDEFIYSFNEDFILSKLLDERIFIDIRWVMNPITNNGSSQSGFYGSACKQISSSYQINNIKSPHRFNNIESPSPGIKEATIYGVILIHNWSRSLTDCLLKSSFSQIRNDEFEASGGRSWM